MLLRKLKRKLRKMPKTSIVITILVFIVLLCMTSGYALLSQKLDIFGTSKIVIPDYRIYISNVAVKSSTDGGYATNTATFTDNEVALYTTLPNLNSSVTYEITIKNIGNSNAITDYMYTASNNASVKYKIKEINSTEVVSKLSERKVLVTVEPIENATAAVGDSTVAINFAFLQENSSYSNSCTMNWDGSSSQQPVSTTILGSTYYLISNANEFKWFMDQVNGGNTTINVMLTDDICLNNMGISPIASSNAYAGIFDGQNRTISGISFTRDEEVSSGNKTSYMGLFYNNSGIIKNVNFIGSYSDVHMAKARENTSYIAGVVINNSGIIENVSFGGTINLNATAHVNCTMRQAHTWNYVGGIASTNTGIIRGSNNKATFTLVGKTTQATCNIYSRSSNIYAGGIASTNSGFIVDSYNSANITMTGSNEEKTRTENIAKIGGIVSTNNNQTKNTYTSGTITQSMDGNGTWDYVTDAIATNSGSYSNTYYLSGSIPTLPSTPIGTLATATDLINLNVSIGNAFKVDNKSINNGYPILFWQ